MGGLFYLHLVQHTGHLGQLVHVRLARDVKHVPQLEAPLAVDVRDPHLLGAARQRNVVEIGEEFEQLRHRAARDVEVGDRLQRGEVHLGRVGAALEDVLLGRVGHGLVLHPQRLLLDQLRAHRDELGLDHLQPCKIYVGGQVAHAVVVERLLRLLRRLGRERCAPV